MQKIFYNARFLTLNNNFEVAEAMLVNDDSIVFVGEKNEVLQMKTDETELVDLNDSFVMPTFFDLNLSVYTQIENNIKNANNENFIENFDIYKAEFLKIQNELLESGITTIHENISSKSEFVFWKKISESHDLKIEVIGYIDFIKHKQIMDDNCRSYRKYKNHFRLGGYYVSLDGSILDKHAWLKKHYPKEGKYCGYSEIGYEQLSFIIKTAIEEKKQLVIKAEGDRAVDEFLKCYEEYIQKNTVEDNFKPIISGCNFISKKMLKKVQELKIICNFEIDNLVHYRNVLKSVFGVFRLRKILPLNGLFKENQNFLMCYKSDKNFKPQELIKKFLSKDCEKTFLLKKKNRPNEKDLLKSIIEMSSVYSFDYEQKGSLESGKRATFLVFDKNVFAQNEDDAELQSVYIEGEKIYEKK